VTDGELSEEGAAVLLRLRVMLCIPQNTVEAAHSDICGSLFGKVLCVFLPLWLIGSISTKILCTHFLTN
jgi:hypothetical protein